MPKTRWADLLIGRLLYGVLPITAILIVIAILIYIFRQDLLLRGAQGALHHFVGFRNTVENAEFLPGGRGVRLTNVSLRNPAVFRVRPEFAFIPEIIIELDNPVWLEGKLNIKRVFMDVKRINVVQWDRGAVNLSYLSGMRAGTESEIGLESEDNIVEKEKHYLFQIRRFEIHLAQVEFTDTTGRRRAVSQKFTEPRSHTFTNLHGIPDLIRAAVALAVAERPIPAEKLPIDQRLAEFRRSATQQSGEEITLLTNDASDQTEQTTQPIFQTDLPPEEVISRPVEVDVTMQEDDETPIPEEDFSQPTQQDSSP